MCFGGGQIERAEYQISHPERACQVFKKSKFRFTLHRDNLAQKYTGKLSANLRLYQSVLLIITIQGEFFMSNSGIPPEMSQQLEEDEINLNELFSKIWRRRKFIAALVALVMVLVAGISAVQYMIKPSVKNYSESVRFNFPSSIQGTYPSGQRFSKNDLITTAVLKQVYDNNNLKDQKVKFEEFAASFTVAPYAVNSEFIKYKYDNLLANKKLTRTEIEALEQQYIDELNAAQSNFAKVSYVDTLHLGLSAGLIEKILIDVPKVWSAISIQDLGVLDLKIPGQQFYQAELVDQYEYLQGVQYMLDSSKRFKEILDILQKDDLGGFVRDPETDMVVSDILARLENIKRFDLDPLYAVIANLGLVKDREKANLYLTNQIELMQDQMAELKLKSQVYKSAIQTYTAQGKSSSGGSAAGGDLSSGMVQYGDSFLSKIVGMVEQQKDIEYRQALLTKEIDLSIELQEMTTEHEKLKRALKVLKTNKLSTGDLVKEYAAAINKINTSFIKLVSSYQRILELRNLQLLGKSSALYELASDEMKESSDLKSRIKKIMLITIVSGVLALMLAMFVALIVKEKNPAADVSA